MVAPARKATVQDIRFILREKFSDVRKEIGQSEADLAMSGDGRGLRIIAGFDSPERPSLQKSISIANHDGELVTIQVEYVRKEPSAAQHAVI